MYIDFPLMLAVSTLVVGVFALCRILVGKARVGRVLAEAVFGFYLAALFAITLFPSMNGGVLGDPFTNSTWINLTPFETILAMAGGSRGEFIRQVGGNLILLFPLGVFVPALFPKLRTVKAMLVLALAVPCGIELLQFVEVVLRIAARSVDIDDVILNAAGLIAGYAVFFLAHRLYAVLFPQRGTLSSRRLKNR